MTLQLGTWWQYVGPGGGRGQLHKVLWIDSEGVVTVGLCSPEYWHLAQDNCWSWCGSLSEFFACFRSNYKK